MEAKGATGGTAHKKVVYEEPGRPARAIVGAVTEEGDFFRVVNSRGEMLISRRAVICIKEVAE